MIEPQREIRPQKRKETAPDHSTPQSPQLPQSSNSLSKVSHRSLACIACQKKRRRCNGAEGHPCSECIKLAVACIFDRDSDRRRRPQRERAKKDQELLHKLFDALKTWPEQEVSPLLQAIQQEGASTTDLEGLLGKASSLTDGASRTSKDPVDGYREGPGSVLSGSESFTFGSERADFPASIVRPLAEGNVPDFGSGGPFVLPGAVRSFQNLQMSGGVVANQYPPAIQRQQIDIKNMPHYLCTPTILDNNSQKEPLTGSVLAFLYAARLSIMEGNPVADLLSMDGLDLDLFFRARTPEDPHTVSTWACEFAKAFSHLSFVLRLNIIHSVGSFMRWLILPCQKTWGIMNPLMRPLKSQVMTPHDSLYVDLCHIPQLRLAQLVHGRGIEELTARPNWADCNWFFDDRACVEVDEDSGRPRRLSLAFVEHITDMSNWTVHRSAIDIFPELGEADNRIALHDDDQSQ